MIGRTLYNSANQTGTSSKLLMEVIKGTALAPELLSQLLQQRIDQRCAEPAFILLRSPATFSDKRPIKLSSS
jgi:hypothetical protein